MSRFLTGIALEKAITDIIWEAKETLLIVSPFIKLDNYFKKLFDKHRNNPSIHIIIVFGKNEKNFNRSFGKIDFDYFKQFLNISIVYAPDLHGKYYGNEKEGILTSVNFYDYSFKNNIEFGVYWEYTLLSNFQSTPDDEAYNTCINIAYNNPVILVRRPVYEKKLLSSLLGRNYIKSDTLVDLTNDFDSLKTKTQVLDEFPEEIILGAKEVNKPEREMTHAQELGYCIRTGERIPFNIKKPMSRNAYLEWAKYKNYKYKEKYCHKTGKHSEGKTTMENPIL